MGRSWGLFKVWLRILSVYDRIRLSRNIKIIRIYISEKQDKKIRQRNRNKVVKNLIKIYYGYMLSLNKLLNCTGTGLNETFPQPVLNLQSCRIGDLGKDPVKMGSDRLDPEPAVKDPTWTCQRLLYTRLYFQYQAILTRAPSPVLRRA